MSDVPDRREGDPPAALRATPPSSPVERAAGAHTVPLNLANAVWSAVKDLTAPSNVVADAALVALIREWPAALASVAPASERSEGSHSDAPSGAAPDRDVTCEHARGYVMDRYELADSGACVPCLIWRKNQLLSELRETIAERDRCYREIAALDSAQRGAGSPRPAASDAGAMINTLDTERLWVLLRQQPTGFQRHAAVLEWLASMGWEFRAPAPRLGEAAPAVRVEPREERNA